MFKDCVDFDVPDNEIDTTVTVCFDRNTVDEVSKDYPYMDKFTKLLLEKVEVDCLLSDGTPICRFSKLINDNKELFIEFIRKEWRENLQWLIDDTSGEFEYEIIKEFDNVVGGRYGESNNKSYYQLLRKCK
jgi:hypothetical protein